MSDAKDAVEATAFALLAAGISGATVFQDVPEDFSGPLVAIGDTTAKRIGAKQGGDARVSIEFVTLVNAEERAPLLALQGQIFDLLDNATMNPTGWILSFTFEEDEARLHENGVSYVGSSVFSVFALQA